MSNSPTVQQGRDERVRCFARHPSPQGHHCLRLSVRLLGIDVPRHRITSAEGIPPLVMCAMRFLIAGPIMLAACTMFGRNIRITGRDALRLAAIGVLLLVCGNGTLAWAEQYVPTGFAALIIAVTPIWFLVLETFVFRGDRISRRGAIGLLMGVLGIAILVWPKIAHRESLGTMQLLGSISLLFSSLSWAVGSVLSRRWQMKVDPLVATGWEMLLRQSRALDVGATDRPDSPRGLQPSRRHGRACTWLSSVRGSATPRMSGC